MYIMLIAQTINFLCHSAQPYKGILLTHILIYSPTAVDTAVVAVATVVVEEEATEVVVVDMEEEVVDMAVVVVDLVVRTLYQQSYIARANAPGSGGYGAGGFGGMF